MMVYGNITCNRCGITWYGPKCGKLYCDKCRKIIRNKASIRCKNKKKHKPTFIEIVRMADAEGLSYGKYCLKYGI